MKCFHSRHKYRIRALFRSIAFIAVAGVYCVFNLIFAYSIQIEESESTFVGDAMVGRQLTSAESCDDIKKADPPWMVVFYFIGVLYMFLAIAIVCDELFVPTLEEMSSERHLNLSMDVAGATLMAAGGSTPEFFTSLIGTFVTEDEVGIGTVVGSAVFNVLFVIAMCAFFSKEVLTLTWWPLARDSIYYAICLIILGLFVGVISKGEIELWEAIVLFIMYIGYVILMWYNEVLYKAITGKDLALLRGTVTEESAVLDTDHESTTNNDDAIVETINERDDYADEDNPLPDSLQHTLSMLSLHGISSRSITSLGPGSLQPTPSNRSVLSVATNASNNKGFPWPGTFRTGILKILRDPNSWAETAGVGIVAQIAGDAEKVFQKVDIDGNGELDKEELSQLFAKLDCRPTSAELDEVMKELDHDNDGKISEADFAVWYIESEDRIRNEVRTVFNFIDSDHSGTIDREKVKILLEKVEPSVTDQDIDQAMLVMYQSGSRDVITFEEFSDWYMHSMLYHRQKKRVEEELEHKSEGIWESLRPPEERTCMGYIKYVILFPIVAALAFTVPDVRIKRKWCYVSFFLSIIWIGAFSYFMVKWTEIIGNTIGIPPVIMGLTLLAAGTSVPDLLSSVIVARMGEGDMAVSSSIGSNIFDILVGLPVPWIIYTAWPTKPDTVTVRVSRNNRDDMLILIMPRTFLPFYLFFISQAKAFLY
mmetsp:Transcript_2684/g.4868  ORF Transcript_2684/g.4868 Transcript_2684/m.4868 type:complete len:707 (-) Transcript_2684:911-3031(-)